MLFAYFLPNSGLPNFNPQDYDNFHPNWQLMGVSLALTAKSAIILP
jgi:hypothetical protein